MADRSSPGPTHTKRGQPLPTGGRGHGQPVVSWAPLPALSDIEYYSARLSTLAGEFLRRQLEACSASQWTVIERRCDRQCCTMCTGYEISRRTGTDCCTCPPTPFLGHGFLGPFD